MNLGKIIGVSKTRHVILRTTDWQSIKNTPNIGDSVFNIDKKKIGSIYDIFGPVTKPYISIKLYNSELNHLDLYQHQKGEFLYTFREQKKKKRSYRSKPPSSRGFRRISPQK